MLGSITIKGFVLSLDAIIAVVIAVTATAAVVAVTSTSKSQAYGNIPINRAAQDVLTLMDKQGILTGFFNKSDSDAQAQLSSILSSYIPVNMGAKMNVTICTYTGPGFSCGRYFEAQKGIGGEHKSVARRVFADMPNNRYGLAVIEVWYE